jgi:ribosomal protein L11 methyltransferase
VTDNATSAAPIPCVEVSVASGDVALVEDVIAALGLSCASWLNVDSGAALVWVFADSAAEAEHYGRLVAAGLTARAGLFRGRAPTSCVTTLRREDWEHSWKRHFPAFRASRRLVLKPSWESFAGGPDDIVLELDPGMCFGTGYHGTTRACLEFMDDLATRLGPVSFLDAGCGSGILSLAAARLGFLPVAAFDHDPQAVETARENLAKAGLTAVNPVVADVADYVPPQRYRVIAANVLATVLEAHRERLCAWLDVAATPAYLILSGIETGQYPRLREAFAELGCAEWACRTLDEWTSGCFDVCPTRR